MPLVYLFKKYVFYIISFYLLLEKDEDLSKKGGKTERKRRIKGERGYQNEVKLGCFKL